MVGVSFLAACGSSSKTASNGKGAGASSSLQIIESQQTEMIALLGEWADAGEDAAKRVPLLDRFIELARQADWMDQLRAYGLSEEVFTKLPAPERDGIRQIYLDRSVALKSLARGALAQAKQSIAQGDHVRAEQLRFAVERVAQANDNEDVVAIGRIVAQSIARAVHPKG